MSLLMSVLPACMLLTLMHDLQSAEAGSLSKARRH